MNTPSSNDGAKSSTGTRLTPTMPPRPSSASSIYSKPKSVSHEKTPSPPLGSNNEDDVHNQTKKPSPLNTRLLSGLKSFNIEKSKYKHYGHQSSMNAQSLHQIMNQETPNKRPTKESSASPVSSTSSSASSSMSVAGQSPEVHIDEVDPSRHEVPLDMGKESESNLSKDSSNKFVIDESIANILGIPSSTLKANYLWPYNIETLNEIVKLKIEQERTKQVLVKQEFGSTVIDLLKMAQSMNINGDLIPLLFVNDDENAAPSIITEHNKLPVNELKNTIKRFKEDPESQKDLLVERAATAASASTKSSAPSTEALTPRSAVKRKFSESSQLPSFNETAENIRQSINRTTSSGTIGGSRSASPVKSPNQLKPNILPISQLNQPGTISSSEEPAMGHNTHRRMISDSSEASAREKEKGSPSNQLAKPFSWPASNPYSQQHSPNLSETFTPPVSNQVSGPVQHQQQPSGLQPQPQLAPGSQNQPSQAQHQQPPPQHQHQQARQEMYPVYYTPAPPRGIVPGSKQTGDLAGTEESGHGSTSSTVLGSPYSQKYQPYVYPNPYQPGSFMPQQPQYYYVSASPSGQVQGGPQGLGPQAQPQYVMPAPGMMVPPYHQVQYQYPDHDRGVGTNHTSPKEETASAPSQSKKHKASAKTSSINFMITTPKNPPAKKYNNSNKDKTSH